MLELENRTALVTGASRGIGRAIALALAAEGARVLVHYGSSREEAQRVVATIQERGSQAHALGADLSTPDGAAILASQAESLAGGRLDIAVLNAGVSKAAPLAAYTVDEVNRLFAINVRGPFFLMQHLAPLLSDGSCVVAVSSAVARMVIGQPDLEAPSILAYAATKGALETLV